MQLIARRKEDGGGAASAPQTSKMCLLKHVFGLKRLTFLRKVTFVAPNVLKRGEGDLGHSPQKLLFTPSLIGS